VSTCAVCGRVTSSQETHCEHCGAALENAGQTLGQDRGLAPRASDPPPAPEAELKHVTVLFVDLVRSTELIASLDPESAMLTLEPLLRTMCNIVQRFGGTIARTMGDGIMALFGAPLAQEGHALLACQAALAIRDAISGDKEAHGARAGLHSGEIVSDTPITGFTGVSSPYGMTLHVGSRVTGEADAGEICISEACYRLAGSLFDVQPLGPRKLRGVPQPVPLYLLTNAKSEPAGQRFLTTHRSAFVGRDRELASLTEALRNVEAGAGRTVGISGVAGAGKSRLCYEFAQFCRARSVRVFETRPQPYGVVTPLQPILELLRTAYFRIAPGDSAAASVTAVGAQLARIGATDDGDLPLVCDFFSIPCPGAQRSWLSARTRDARLREIVRDLVVRNDAATVLIVEDLQWLDDASESFVAMLARVVTATRTMLLVNFRHPYSRTWMGETDYRQIDLNELTASDTTALVEQLMGSRPELSDIRRRVEARSGGNPFFVEELVESLAERGIVAGWRGEFRRGRNVAAEELPATVQAVVGARIDALAQPQRDILQVGSIVGKDFPVAVLQEVLGRDHASPVALLDRLCDGGLLRRSDSGDEPAYQFGHPLIQEVAYTTQLRSRRNRLHVSVAQAIERLYPDRADEFAALVAHHLEEAGERGRAAVHAARAARWIGRMSTEQAIKLWHKVRTLLGDQPRSRANDALRIEASGQIAWVGWREGFTTDQARPFVQEALQWAREIDDSIIPLLLLVDGRIAQVSGGNSDAFVHQVKQAIALAERNRDRGRLATLHAALCHAFGWAGLLRDALAASDASLAHLAEVTEFDQRFLGYSVEHWILGLRGRALLRLGRFDDARACFDRLISINTLIDPTVLFIAHFGYVDMAWCRNDPILAKQHAARIGILAERHGAAYLRLYHLAAQAISDGIAGDYQEAANGTSRTIGFLRQTRAAVEYEPELLANLADYQMRMGDMANATTTARDTIAMGKARGARLPVCRATITQASLAVLTEGAAGCATAISLLAEAEQLIEESGASIYRPRLEEARTLVARTGGAKV
jgi:class 3 adenylate cyclase/tetratricopeptide (TPR) repeat protein